MSSKQDFILPDITGLVAEYLLNGDVKDTSGNGYNGTPSNVLWPKTSRGYQSYCGSFNGSNSKVDCPITMPTNNYSISALMTKGDSD